MHFTYLKRCGKFSALALLWLALTGVAGAQGTSLDAEIADELRDLASHAATVFVGHLEAITCRGSVVEVSFRVEQPVRGAAGPTVVLREWAGNWAPGQTRYVVGSRVLAFLHGSSAAGLSSPVHGAEGLVPVVVQGANAPQLLDIRRVAASVKRGPGVPLPTETNGALPLQDVLGLIAQRGEGVLPRLPIPTRGRLPVDVLPASGPLRTSQHSGMRPGNRPVMEPLGGGISDAHR